MKKKNKKKKKNNASAPSGITKQTFRAFYAVGLNATGNTFTLGETNLTLANMGSRAIDFADIFAEWRMISMKTTCRSFAQVSTTATQAVAFIGNEVYGSYYTQLTPSEYTVPTSFQQTIDFPNFAWGINFGAPVHMKCSRKDLAMDSPFQWLRCNSTGTTEPSLISAGTLGLWSNGQYSVNAITQGVYCVATMVCEFKGPVDTAVVPFFRRPGCILAPVREEKKEKKSEDYSFED